MRNLGRRAARPAAVVSSAVVLFALAAPAAAQDPPLLALETPAATYPDGLGSLRGVRELAGGRVLVADGLGQALIVWTPGGGADTLTNVGEGPEEYETPDGLHALPAGGTLLVDIGNARLAELSAELEFVDTRPVAQGQIGPGMTLLLPVGTDDRGRIYFQQRPPMTEMRDSAWIARFDPATEVIDRLGSVKLQDQQRSESGGANERSVRMRPMPFTTEDAWSVGRDGRVAVARTGEYRLEWIEPDGSVVRGPAVPWEPVRVTGADREAYMEELAGGLGIMVTSDGGPPQLSFSRGGRELAGGADEFTWPAVKPAFAGGAVRVDGAGRAWVRRHVAAGEPPLYDVFDAGGRRIARVTLPEDRRLVAFGERSLYVERRDELEFAWLERYEMPALP